MQKNKYGLVPEGSTTQLKVGSTYKVKHPKNGGFEMKVTKITDMRDGDQFIEGTVANMFGATLRKSYCYFFEVKDENR